ncbi:MAG: type II secretion protein ATPase, partial [Pseudomonadota bacterium]
MLPNASICLFAQDAELRAAAIALRDDWRFARVDIRVEDGDVEMAIARYAHEDSPDLVLVETQEITDGFSGRLEILASSCAENTAAVVIGPVNDVYLYRKLIDMGVSDYLVRPLSQTVLADVFAKILIERLGAPGSKLLAFVGSKGAVCTSTLANIAANVIADDLHQKTIILDVAAGWSFLSVAMGAEATTTLHEVSRAAVSSDKDTFKRMILSVNDKLSFLATGAEPLLDDLVTSESFELIINRLMQSYPIVIVDLSRAPAAIMRAVLARANEVIVVTTPTLPSLRAARGLMQELRTLRGGVENGLHLVVNMKGITQGQDISDADIQSAIKIKSVLSLPFIPKVFSTADAQGKKILDVVGGKDIHNSVLKFLIDDIRFVGESRNTDSSKNTAPAGLLGGLLGKLKTK